MEYPNKMAVMYNVLGVYSLAEPHLLIVYVKYIFNNRHGFMKLLDVYNVKTLSLSQ